MPQCFVVEFYCQFLSKSNCGIEASNGWFGREGWEELSNEFWEMSQIGVAISKKRSYISKAVAG